MTSSSFVSPLDCLTSFLGISLSRAVSSFGRITNVPKLAITAESYIRSWRKPPEMPEVCRMGKSIVKPVGEVICIWKFPNFSDDTLTNQMLVCNVDVYC